MAARDSQFAAGGSAASPSQLRLLGEARNRLQKFQATADPRALNGRLAGLAADLESSDSPPTGPQREVLAQCRAELAALTQRWREFAARELPGAPR